MSAEQFAEIVRRGYHGFNTADIDLLTQVFDADATWETPGKSPIAGLRKGRDNVFAHFGGTYGKDTDGTFKAELQFVSSRQPEVRSGTYLVSSLSCERKSYERGHDRTRRLQRLSLLRRCPVPADPRRASSVLRRETGPACDRAPCSGSGQSLSAIRLSYPVTVPSVAVSWHQRPQRVRPLRQLLSRFSGEKRVSVNFEAARVLFPTRTCKGIDRWTYNDIHKAHIGHHPAPAFTRKATSNSSCP